MPLIVSMWLWTDRLQNDVPSAIFQKVDLTWMYIEEIC